MSNLAPNDFSSTPLKKAFTKPVPLDLDVGVLSDSEDTFSLLSPIYNDSFDSRSQSSGESSPKSARNNLSERCELPKSPSDQLLTSVNLKNPTSLSAWEVWLLNKAKEDKIKWEKRAEEERLLEEKKKLQLKDHEERVVLINQRIQDWLKIKKEQEKEEQSQKQRKKQDALRIQMEKQKEIKVKTQEKYKEWLQKKNQEKAEKQKKMKEEAALKEEHDKERRKRAEEKFREWLNQANTKNKGNPKSTCPYGNPYPSPSFYNPIPWKPIHIPPENGNKTIAKKVVKKPKTQQSLSCNFRQQKYAQPLQR